MSTLPTSSVSTEAVQALEHGDAARAIRLLEAALAQSPEADLQPWTPRPLGGNRHAMLALACFQSEKYALAVQQYEEALKLEPGRNDLR